MSILDEIAQGGYNPMQIIQAYQKGKADKQATADSELERQLKTLQLQDYMEAAPLRQRERVASVRSAEVGATAAERTNKIGEEFDRAKAEQQTIAQAIELDTKRGEKLIEFVPIIQDQKSYDFVVDTLESMKGDVSNYKDRNWKEGLVDMNKEAQSRLNNAEFQRQLALNLAKRKQDMKAGGANFEGMPQLYKLLELRDTYPVNSERWNTYNQAIQKDIMINGDNTLEQIKSKIAAGTKLSDGEVDVLFLNWSSNPINAMIAQNMQAKGKLNMRELLKSQFGGTALEGQTDKQPKPVFGKIEKVK